MENYFIIQRIFTKFGIATLSEQIVQVVRL